MIAYFRRDFISYFKTPIGYIVLGIVALIGGFYLANGIGYGYVNIIEEIYFIQNTLFLVIPLITMRLLSEEKKNGTDVLMHVSPISLNRVVIAKYFSALALFSIICCIIVFHAVVAYSIGATITADTFGFFVSFFFIGSVYLSIGILASALTENQIISAISCLTVIFFSQFIPVLAGQIKSFTFSFMSSFNIFGLSSANTYKIASRLEKIILWFDPYSKFDSYYAGIVTLSPIIFSISIIFVFLFITYRVIEKRRWSQK
ncbi:MAG: hypothetical protein GXY06_01955 [Clostridiaceae bacterium]|nr:hypothetical protein [Clostridiaceae bacterium]